jgi:hypothetical protein
MSSAGGGHSVVLSVGSRDADGSAAPWRRAARLRERGAGGDLDLPLEGEGGAEEERLLLIKTRADRFEALREALVAPPLQVPRCTPCSGRRPRAVPRLAGREPGRKLTASARGQVGQ